MHDEHTGNESLAIVPTVPSVPVVRSEPRGIVAATRKQPKLRDPRLKWRGNTIYCWVPDPDGKLTPGGKPLTVFLSTFARDEAAAVAKANEYERKALSPSFRAAFSYTLAQAVSDYCDFMLTMESKAHPGKRVKPETVEKIKREKMGWLIGYSQDEKGFDNGEQPLGQIDSEWVDGFIKWRSKHPSGRSDGSRVSNYSIKRELNYLRAILTLAKRNKKFPHDLGEVMPTKEQFSGACRRVERYPSRDEATLILSELKNTAGEHDPERAAHIVFLMATGARLKESVLARVGDIDFNEMVVRFTDPDLKNDNSASDIPITPVMEPLLRWVVQAAPGKVPGERLFRPWKNATGQLARVCRRLGIPKYSVHDFRRAFTHLHLDAGIDFSNASLMLRHGPGGAKLVEAIYGKIRDAQRKRARVLPQMTNEVPLPALPPATRQAVGNVSGSDDARSSAMVPLRSEIPENRVIDAVLEPTLSAVHGRGASATYVGVITQKASPEATASVGDLSSDADPANIAVALAAIRNFLRSKASAEERAAVLAELST